MGAEGFGAAHDRPQILRIGEAIHGQQQRCLTKGAATLDQAGQVQGVGRRWLQHGPLMHRPAADLAQPGPGDLFHQHPRRLGLPQQLQETGAKAHFWCTPDSMNRPAALQHRLGGVASPDQIGGGGSRKIPNLTPLLSLRTGNGKAGTSQAGTARARTDQTGTEWAAPITPAQPGRAGPD